MNTKKIAELQQYIESADLALQQAREILTELGGNDFSDRMAKSKVKHLGLNEDENEQQEKIIEGVFNGQNMIGPQGKEYSVPANYASKSKLVEGDVLKLTIQQDGSFIYKQIKPIDRKRLTGSLVIDEVEGQYAVLVPGDKKYNVLTASATYFKGEIGDQVTILVPQEGSCHWAAIENVNKNKQEEKQEDVEPLDKTAGKKELKLKKMNEATKPANNVDNQTEKQPAVEEEQEKSGITQAADKESILPSINDLGREKDGDQEVEQSRQEIENIINNGEEKSNLAQEDLQDL